jgi:hypothetical protein
MKKLKSAVTFFRKQLGFKGNTQHNGRGVYEMEIDYDWDYPRNVEEQIRHCLKNWEMKGMVEKVEDDEKFLVITLKDELFERETWLDNVETYPNQCYRVLYYGKKNHSLGVTMNTSR